MATWPARAVAPPCDDAGVSKGDIGVRDFAVIVDPLLASLDGFVADVTAVRERWEWNPAADSQAMAELALGERFAGAWRTDPLNEAYHHAGLLFIAAEDHATALCRLLRDDATSVFAHVPMARASIEASAIAHRLTSRHIDARARVSRYMSECIYSETELGRALPERADRYRMRRDAIVEQAVALGMKKINNRGRPPSIDAPRPGTTSAVASLFGRDLADPNALDTGKLLYSLYSAIAHGTVYGLQRSLEPLGTDHELHPDWMPHPTQVIAGVYVDADDVAHLVGAVTHAYLLAAAPYLQLMGWWTDELSAQAHNALALIRRATDAADARLRARSS